MPLFAIETHLPMRDHAQMVIFDFTRHTGLRIAELGLALIAVAGVAILLGALTPFGRKPGSAVGGVALAAGAVLLIVAVHWGGFN